MSFSSNICTVKRTTLGHSVVIVITKFIFEVAASTIFNICNRGDGKKERKREKKTCMVDIRVINNAECANQINLLAALTEGCLCASSQKKVYMYSL